MVKIWKVNIRLCNVLTLYLCKLFLLREGKWTGYGLSRSVFVTFASSKRGLTSLICCSVINIFCWWSVLCKMPPSNACVFLSDMPAINVVWFLLSHFMSILQNVCCLCRFWIICSYVKRLCRLQGHNAAGRIMSMKNLSASTDLAISYPKRWVKLTFIGL